MKINRICQNCSKEFLAHQSEIKRRRGEGGKFCCRKCHLIFSQKGGGFNRKHGTMRHKGYILVWASKHPSNVNGYVYQHRLVMENKLGRLLTKKEIVHHINHKKDDNRIENLELTNAIAHAKHHHQKVLVILNGKTINYSGAIKELGYDYSSAKRMRRIKNWTHQETIDYYNHKPKKVMINDNCRG